jgi:hypothetical protein
MTEGECGLRRLTRIAAPTAFGPQRIAQRHMVVDPLQPFAHHTVSLLLRRTGAPAAAGVEFGQDLVLDLERGALQNPDGGRQKMEQNPFAARC